MMSISGPGRELNSPEFTFIGLLRWWPVLVPLVVILAVADAVFHRRAEDTRETVVASRLDMIHYAFRIHNAKTGKYPQLAKCDAEGRPLLSWRVLILEDLFEEELAAQFHYDEPWDSEHNKKLIPLMPSVFSHRGALIHNPQGKTSFIGLPAKSDNGIDGPCSTIETIADVPDTEVVWTQPDPAIEVTFRPARPNVGSRSFPKFGYWRVGNADIEWYDHSEK